MIRRILLTLALAALGGVANAGAMRNAFELACAMGARVEASA